jgi:uncharacterized protein DUF4145
MTTIACTTCNARTQLEIEGQYDRSRDDEEGLPPRHYLLGRCVVCSAPAIVVTEQIGPMTWRPQQLFPVQPRGIDAPLPPLVDQSYREAVTCSSAGASLATVVMVRRTLEAIGKQFKPDANRLFDGLKAMKEQGIISAELLDWGDHLRFLGNIGAHPSEQVVSAEDGRDAMEFLEAIAETIFHLRPKFEAMKARRTKGKAKPGSSDGGDG